MTQPIDMQQLERKPWLLPSFAGVIAAATEYRATCGARPTFKTAEAAAEYDRGYSAYPSEIRDAAIDSPAMRGWIEAEIRDERRVEQRADRAFEGAQS